MDEACPSEEQLAAYVDGDLSGADMLALERHLDACPSCTEVLAALAPAMTIGNASDGVPNDPSTGVLLDRYEVKKRLGAGAMGVVVEAFDPELQRRVAIKVVRAAGSSGSASERARMLREAQAMARLSHPNVVPVLAVGTRGDDLYVVMELVEGKTMRAWLDESPRPWRAIVRAYAAAGRGLAAAHATGVVHRDFKPDNVLIGRGQGDAPIVRVIDFGLARFVTELAPDIEDSLQSGSSSVERTAVGVVVGTLAYMPPEQLLDANVDARADQFALAVSLWEGLYGERPFAGRSPATLLEEVEAGRLRRPTSARSVPSAVRSVLVRALSAAPDRRFATMAVFVDALERATTSRTRRATVAAAGAIVLVGFVAMAPRATDPCDPETVPRWDDERRTLVREAFANHGGTAATSAGAVERGLDRRIVAWHDAYANACVVHGSDENAWAGARACLDVRRLELDATVDVIAAGDRDVLLRATDLIVRLPAVEPCANASDPRLALADPDAIVEEATLLRGDLARARALGDAGRFDEAQRIARGVLERAEAIGHAPLHAEAAFRVGSLHTHAGEFGAAVPLLEAAYFEAKEVGHDEIVASAALGLVETVGVRLARLEDGKAWLKHAEVAFERWGSREGTAELARQRGAIAQRGGDYEGAVAHFREAYDRTLAIFDEDDPQRARAIENLGTAYHFAGDYDRALELQQEGLKLREGIFGEQHPLVAFSLNNIAMTFVAMGQGEVALDYYAWSVQMCRDMYGPDHIMVAAGFNNIGSAWGSLGEHALALDAFLAARPGYEILGPEHPDLAMLLGNIGSASFEVGDIETALASTERAYTIYERELGPEHERTRNLAALLERIHAAIEGQR